MQLAWQSRSSLPNDEADHLSLVEVNDHDLAIVRLAQADPAAFAPLYERYAPIVYHYCLRRLSQPETASDAAAAVFARAIAALPRFQPDPKRQGSTFRSWLFTIAHNVVIDTRRRTRHHVSLDASAEILSTSPYLVDPGASPEDLAITADDARRVRVMLERLPDRQRSIVELRLAGLSGAEIAQSLGMSESAVKSAQFRAYQTLRDLLAPNPSPNTPESPR
jgi:RNA polymerase sigma-70 factor (ECF subfamily)